MLARFYLLYIIALAFFSAGIATWTSAHNFYTLTFFSLLSFSFFILWLAEGINPPKGIKILLHKKSIPPQSIYWNTFLTFIVYAWGGLCFLSIYIFSGLVWQHGVQYGVAATLISLALFLFWYISDWDLSKHSQKIFLASLHGLSLFIGLTYLFLSGKLSTLRGDWAANYIFLSGGLTLLTLYLFTLWRDKNLVADPNFKDR